MGAADFQTIGLGKDLGEAFNRAYEADVAEHGHEQGYSGSLGSKHGTTAPVVLPARWKLQDFVRAISVASQVLDGGTFYSAKERSAHQRLVRDLPIWRHVAEVYGDKWADAVAIEVTGSQASKIKADRGRAGTRDRVFAFVGNAPC